MTPPALTPEGTGRMRAMSAIARGASSPLPYPQEIERKLLEIDQPTELLYLAWELTRWSAAPPSSPALRAQMVLAVATLVALAQGHDCLPLGQAETPRRAFFEALLVALGIEEAERAALHARCDAAVAGAPSALGDLVGSPGERCPLVLDADALYIQRVYVAETQLALALRDRLNPTRARVRWLPAEIQAAVADVWAHPLARDGDITRHSAEQRRAVEVALERPLTVVSGGPGTGKTSVVITLLRVLVRLGVTPAQIALAAPTGKAAHRMALAMAQQLGARQGLATIDGILADHLPVPTTLHRLLGFHPARRTFHFHERRPLPHAFVIVDEGSMIDLSMADTLCRALAADTQLCLLGDADQIPSVESGTVFRDLSGRGVRLTRSFRVNLDRPEGRALADVADRFRLGNRNHALTVRARAAEVTFSGAEFLVGAAAAREEFLERWFHRFVVPTGAAAECLGPAWRWQGGTLSESQHRAVAALCSHFDAARLLSITRGPARSSGAASLNEALLDMWRRAGLGGWTAGRFSVGVPVIMQRNDHDRDLWNGDSGVIVAVAGQDGGAAMHAVFARPREQGFASFPLDAVARDLELGFALTVHKAQGSEFDSVGVILPDQDLALTSRQILYTALSRARSSAVLVGRRDVLEAGLARSAERMSGLAARLQPG